MENWEKPEVVRNRLTGDKFILKQVSGVHPLIRMWGIERGYSDDQVLELLVVENRVFVKSIGEARFRDGVRLTTRRPARNGRTEDWILLSL